MKILVIVAAVLMGSIYSVSDDQKKIMQSSGGLYDLITLDDTSHIQKALITINYLGWCVLPRVAIAGRRFLEAFYRNYGIDREKYNHVLEVETMLDRVFEYEEKKVRIPFLTHHVWLTSASNPREMVDVVQDPEIKRQLSVKINYLNELLAADPLNKDESGNQVHKWEHIFWVNDKSLIPRSVEFMQQAGYVVRELNELKAFQSGPLVDALEEYLDEYKAGAASDFVR